VNQRRPGGRFDAQPQKTAPAPQGGIGSIVESILLEHPPAAYRAQLLQHPDERGQVGHGQLNLDLVVRPGGSHGAQYSAVPVVMDRPSRLENSHVKAELARFAVYKKRNEESCQGTAVPA
jgi:hypothetical protein